MTTAYRAAGYRLVDTFLGDTVQRVAERELGDAARWPEIAAFNGLDAPYIVDGVSGLEAQEVAAAGARVVVAGQRLKVPAAPPPSAVSDPRDVYGTDLLLEPGVGGPDGRGAGGLLLADPETGDLATVSDLPNLRQALGHRVATHEGELVWHPSYGNPLHAMKGWGHGPALLQLARARGERTLRADPRVADVPRAAANADGDALVLDAVVEAIDGRPLPVGRGAEDAG